MKKKETICEVLFILFEPLPIVLNQQRRHTILLFWTLKIKTTGIYFYTNPRVVASAGFYCHITFCSYAVKYNDRKGTVYKKSSLLTPIGMKKKFFASEK